MKLRTKEMLRAVLALFLVVVAAFGSFMIKDFLALKNPVSALPTLTVYHKGVPIPLEYVEMANYEWRFMLQKTSSGKDNPNFWFASMGHASVSPGVPLGVAFSYNCQNVTISCFSYKEYENAQEKGSFVFTPIEGELKTPIFPGKYAYRVEANWGWLGSVQYYFKIIVR